MSRLELIVTVVVEATKWAKGVDEFRLLAPDTDEFRLLAPDTDDWKDVKVCVFSLP